MPIQKNSENGLFSVIRDDFGSDIVLHGLSFKEIVRVDNLHRLPPIFVRDGEW